MPNCPVCQAITDNRNVVLRTDHWLVQLSSEQTYLGKCYVSSLEHKGTLSDLTEAEWLDFAKIVNKMEAAVKEAFDATLCNWVCLTNNAYQESPPDPHVHWKLRPRYEKLVKFAGATFTDPNFGYHYDPHDKTTVPQYVLDKIIDRLKQ